MKMVKSHFHGAAAGLLAMSGAQAADLPVKAKPVEYVKICSLYGAGFFYIPGTDTCLKLGGYLRVDTTFNGSIYDQPAWSGDLGQRNRYMDYFAARSRLALTVDTRTATEYGVIRTFGQADFQFSTLGSSTFNPNSINTSIPVASSNLLDTVGGGYVAVEYVFIQFAGFTFGKSSSAFATPWNGYPGNNTSFLLGGHDTVTGVNNIQYTAQFGNGVSATIGLDEPTVFNRTTVANLNLPLTATGGIAQAYGGVHSPDIVGNIRVDQAWGLWQISAAGHEVDASYNILNGSFNGTLPTSTPFVAPVATNPTGAPNALSEISGHPGTEWGWAVSTALQIKNIPFGPGDDIKMDATYSKGDTKQVISTSSGSPSFAMLSGSSGAAYQSVGFGATTDAVYLPVVSGGDGSLHLTTAWGFRGAYNHNWDAYWSSSLFGAYAGVRYDNTAKAFICANFIARATTFRSVDFSCNPDYNVAQIGVVTRWTPVKNFTFSAEVMWFNLDQKFTGSANLLSVSAPKPVALYDFKDQNAVSLNVRVQRNF
jgi:hypothetical protein